MSTATDRPASILRETKAVADPAERISGMPPNFGEQLMPHVVSFVGITAGVARVYRPSDEALKNSFENARFMLNDIMVTECLEQRRRSTALLDWHLEPDNEQDPKQKWLAEQLQAILETTPSFMQFRESLLYAIWYGRYANQVRYRWKKIRGEMRLAIDRWFPVNGDKLVFRFDDGTGTYDCDQVGIRVGAGFTSGHSVSKRWGESRLQKVQPTDYGLAYFLDDWERPLLAIHRHMIEDGEYEDPLSAGRINGVGIRHRVYWAWYQKQESLAFLMEYLERSASGIEIWYYPWGNSDARERTQKAAEERIGAGRNIVLVPRPMGEEGMAYGVERIEPSMAGADALDRIIREFFGHQIKRYILGQTLTTEAGSTGLGSNLASVHLDTYMQIIRYDATNLEETMTSEVVEPLKAFNFPQYADIPVRFKIDTEAPDVESKLAAWEKAYQMGLKLKAQDVMDLIGASKPDSKDEVLQDPQHRQAAMQEQQAAQQQAAAQAQQANGRRAQAQGFDPRERQAGAVVDHVNLTEALAERGLAASQYDAVDGSAKSENAEREKLRAYSAEDALARGCEQEQEEHGFDKATSCKIARDHLREDPEYYSKLRERIAQAAAETDTDPSDEAKQSGNYRKGKVRLHGLEITIENPQGSIRSGTDRTGKAWSITMPHHYGYIRRTESEADGDHVDVFLGPHPESEVVFVVDQVKGDSRRFDEHKVMIGWTSERKAREAYLAAYSPGWQGLGEITAMTMPQFKAWLEHGDTGSRAADQVSRYGRRGERIVLEEGRDWASCYTKKWEEKKHPRDKSGEFTEKGSSGGYVGEAQADLFGGESKRTWKQAETRPAVKAKQQTMFHGLNDLPGQQDLFDDLDAGTAWKDWEDKGDGEQDTATAPEQPGKVQQPEPADWPETKAEPATAEGEDDESFTAIEQAFFDQIARSPMSNRDKILARAKKAGLSKESARKVTDHLLSRRSKEKTARRAAKIAEHAQAQKDWEDYTSRHRFHFNGRNRESLSEAAEWLFQQPDWDLEFAHVGSAYFRHRPTNTRVRVSDHIEKQLGSISHVYIEPADAARGIEHVAGKIASALTTRLQSSPRPSGRTTPTPPTLAAPTPESLPSSTVRSGDVLAPNAQPLPGAPAVQNRTVTAVPGPAGRSETVLPHESTSVSPPKTTGGKRADYTPEEKPEQRLLFRRRTTHDNPLVEQFAREFAARWIEVYAKKHKPAAGQKGLWDEEDHPRDDDGKFAEKGTGSVHHPGEDDSAKQKGLFEDKPPEEKKPEKPPETAADATGDELADESIDEPAADQEASQEDARTDPADSPREAAGKLFDEERASEYIYARASKIGNAGEDLLGSARHKVNAWRGLEEAERNGTAAELVTRDKLLKNEPHSLMVAADARPLTALAMHFALSKFPPKPGYGKGRSKPDEETAAKDRRQFLEAYRRLKQKAEEVAAREDDPKKAVDEFRTEVTALVREFRGQKSDDSMGRATATDPYNNTANSLINLLNLTSTWKSRQAHNVYRQLGEFTAKAKEAYSDVGANRDKIAEHAKDIIEGRSLNETFGTKGEGGKKREFNPADLYVKKAERTGGRKLSADTANQAVKYMVEGMKLRGVQWGNSVTDEEREHHAVKAAEAMMDLADILGLDDSEISIDGKLGFAIGARGKGNALAHYEPGSTVINLTRKSGTGSLAHEWGHYFDHQLAGGKIVNDPVKGRLAGDFYSEWIWPKRDVRDEQGRTVIEEDEKGRKRAKQVDLTKDPVWQAYDKLRQGWRSSGFELRLRRALAEAVQSGQMSKKKREYWSSNIEVFARTFERYAQRKLEKQDRRNTYLAGGEWHDFWPTDEETDAMIPAFDALFAAYREQKKQSAV